LVEKLLQLGLGKLLLGHLAWSHRLGSSKGWPLSRLLLEGRLLLRLLLECRLLLRLLLEELLLLGGKLLLLLGNKLLLLLGGKLLLLGQEVSGQGINLTILIIITGESLQSNLFPGKLRQGDLLRLLRGKLLLLRSELLLLLRSKLLLLGSKLLLLLGSELLLLLRSKLLLLGSKLPLLLRSKLLLLLGGKLLRILSKLLVLLELLLELTRLLLGKLLGLLLSKLLLLLEVLEISIKVLGVELLGGRSAGVEVGGIEHWPPGSLLLSVVGEGLPLRTSVVLGGDPLLLLDDGLLEGEHSLVPLFLQLEGRVGLLNWSVDFDSLSCGKLQVRGKASAVVGGVFNDLDLAVLIHDAILSLHISLGVLGLQLEGAVTGLVSHSVGSVLVDLIDLLHNHHWRLGGGAGGHGGGGGGGHGHLLAAAALSLLGEG